MVLRFQSLEVERTRKMKGNKGLFFIFLFFIFYFLYHVFVVKVQEPV